MARRLQVEIFLRDRDDGLELHEVPGPPIRIESQLAGGKEWLHLAHRVNGHIQFLSIRCDDIIALNISRQ